ncbi:hypothetical protein FVU19_20545 [Salmonella enterica]|nr:hypothetical protein [Salmonella enterica]
MFNFEGIKLSNHEENSGTAADKLARLSDAMRPAFLGGTLPPVPFNSWDGKTGDLRRDKKRQAMADSKVSASDGSKLPLRYVPPIVSPAGTGKWDVLNHADNLRWMLYRNDARLELNLMTFRVELSSADGSGLLEPDDFTARSWMLNKCAETGVKRQSVDDFAYYVARSAAYHPVARLLGSREWDGVPRVDAVLDCVPVAPGKEDLRSSLLRGLLIAAISAVEEGSVSCKYVPCLFSVSTDWFKTAFYRAMFDVLPGAFKQGVSIDPSSKDSVRKAVMCWFSELGEISGMMKKNDPDEIKAFVERRDDEWRPENEKATVIKKRQTVMGGTVNKTYLGDETAASRFPTIPLADKIDIYRVNELLGWEWDAAKGVAVRVDEEQLIQFWLEVRHLYRSGVSFVLDAETLKAAAAVTDSFIDRGEYYDAVRDILLLPGNASTGHYPWDKPGYDGRFTATDVTAALRAPSSHSGRVGKALKRLADEGVVERRNHRGSFVYWKMPDEPTGDLPL